MSLASAGPRIYPRRASQLITHRTRVLKKSNVEIRTVVWVVAGAAMALHAARWSENQPVVVVSAAARQSGFLFRKCRQFYDAVPSMPRLIHDTADILEFENRSQILALPADPRTIRGISNASAVIVDEAGFADDELLEAVEPMLSVSGGPLWLLSTPNGRRGFFFHEWSRRDDSFRRFKATWEECPHISAEFVEKRRRRWPAWKIEQEFECRFVANDLSVFDLEAWRRAITTEESTLWPN